MLESSAGKKVVQKLGAPEGGKGGRYSKFGGRWRVAEASKIQEMRLLHIEPRSKKRSLWSRAAEE